MTSGLILKAFLVQVIMLIIQSKEIKFKNILTEYILFLEFDLR